MNVNVKHGIAAVIGAALAWGVIAGVPMPGDGNANRGRRGRKRRRERRP